MNGYKYSSWMGWGKMEKNKTSLNYTANKNINKSFLITFWGSLRVNKTCTHFQYFTEVKIELLYKIIKQKNTHTKSAAFYTNPFLQFSYYYYLNETFEFLLYFKVCLSQIWSLIVTNQCQQIIRKLSLIVGIIWKLIKI